MNLALYGTLTRNTRLDCVRGLLEFLYGHRIPYRLYAPYAQELSEHFTDLVAELEPRFDSIQDLQDCDYLYSLGGDGTLLDAATLAYPHDLPIVGVNMGRLGFLTAIPQEDLILVTRELMHNRYHLEERHALQVVSNRPQLFGDVDLALNEVTIHKSTSNEMITVQVYVNGEFLNTYWADGLVISTPTGSTAYNLACGGPIISPTVQGNVITPIAPHSLTVRPILLPSNDVISILVESRSGQSLVAMDHRTYLIDNQVELAIRRASRPIRLVQINPASYYTTLRNRLNWGLDTRN
ncbi:MAG: NAD(+)/NADH kinase [Bacteroidetes bacterium]|jgi:NAD+ kinase|nr:NAD(+)/NADH kinase [Bacteroidota bacterium]